MKHDRDRTVVGEVDSAVLEYTAGRDYEMDRQLVEVDCIGTAAHVEMLSALALEPPLINARQKVDIIAVLNGIIQESKAGRFEITVQDQDVHLAIERRLTEKLGPLGKKVHTARSRNDQIALDLRLYSREQILGTITEAAELAESILQLARDNSEVPMVGRTHLQPAMPSSVGLWASSYAESILSDVQLLYSAYEQSDCCPLGSAASYGVPLKIDRNLVAELLGFSKPCHNVLAAANSRGKLESILLSALSQIMLTLSRLAQDLIIFTMPEFGYFVLPEGYTTGSSIMPQKRNPDLLELIRARSAKVKSEFDCVFNIVQSSPSGYNRDLQEAKEPLMNGISLTRQTLRVLPGLFDGLEVDRDALLRGFTRDVFATDRALELVAEGMPFRDAYNHVKENLSELAKQDPHEAIAKKDHLGAPAGIDFALLEGRIRDEIEFCKNARERMGRKIAKLLDPTPAAHGDPE